MNRKTGFFVAVAMTLSLASLAGCKDNTAASAKCAAVTEGDACGECCKANGASGHKFSSGSPCGCLGGGD